MSANKIKDILLFFIITTFWTTIKAYPQNSNFSLGVSTGPNISWLRTSSDVRDFLYPNKRFSFSVNVEYQFFKQFYLQSGLSYELKGAKIPHMVFFDSLGNTSGETSLFLNYGYLTLPLIAKYKFPFSVHHIPFQWSVGAGGYFGYLTSRTEKIKGPNINDTLWHRGIVYDDKADWGLLAQAEIQYFLSPYWNIGIQTQFHYGIHNIIRYPDKNNLAPFYTNSRQTNIDFKIGLAYIFHKRNTSNEKPRNL